MPNEPKLHHFLPEAHLRRFADERGDLWVLDRKQQIVRRQSPEVTAAERELYTLHWLETTVNAREASQASEALFAAIRNAANLLEPSPGSDDEPPGV